MAGATVRDRRSTLQLGVETEAADSFDSTLQMSADQSAMAMSHPQGKILLIEDDPIIVDLLKEVLSAANYRVLVANNARDGVRLFEAHHHEIFCIVLDYEIPGMHPERMLERFAALQEGVRVVISSGYPRSFIAREFPVERVSGYLSKPYDPQVLVQELQKLAVSEATLA